MKSMLQSALECAANGISIFPCRPDKKPYTKNGFKAATTDEAQIRRWWQQWTDAMIGMPTGKENGVWVLDVDAAKFESDTDGFVSLDELVRRYGELPATRSQETCNGGKHYLWRYSTNGREVRNSTSKIGDKLDVRGDGGYIILAPSLTPDGRAYKLVDDIPVADAPEWLLDLVAPTSNPAASSCSQGAYPLSAEEVEHANTVLETTLSKLAATSQGSRNDALNRAAFILGQFVSSGVLSNEEATERLFHSAEQCGLVKDDGAGQVYKTIWSGLSKGKEKPRIQQSSRDDTAEEQVGSIILPSPPPVPLEAFPSTIAAILKEASDAFSAPLQIPTACLLGMLSCLVGATRLISIRQSWKEPGNIWIAIVAQSGSGKTPCAAAFFKSVKALEYEAFKKWQEQHEKYEYEHEFFRKERSKAKNTDLLLTKPEPPKRKQAYIDDATIEALGDALSQNPRGVMWRRDELSGLIADLDKYSIKGSNGGAHARLLSSYDGQEWKTSRTSNPSRNLYIPEAYVGIFGGIQPGMLPKIFDTGATGSDEASGFLQRFMLIRAHREKPAYWTENFLSKQSEQTLESIARVLWAWDVEFNEYGRKREKVTHVLPEAKELFISWYNSLAQEEFLSQNSALLAKLKGQAQRLCLLLHCLDAALSGADSMNPVPAPTMRRALLLADWVKEHQVQCWQFFSLNKKAKQASPIERAIMQVVLESLVVIESNGWKIVSSELHSLVEKKLGMSGISSNSISKAATSLGLGTGWIGKNTRARTVTLELVTHFKNAVGSVGTDGTCSGTKENSN